MVERFKQWILQVTCSHKMWAFDLESRKLQCSSCGKQADVEAFKTVNERQKDEYRLGPDRIRLDERDFAQLIAGEMVDKKKVKIFLADIGYHRIQFLVANQITRTFRHNTDGN